MKIINENTIRKIVRSSLLSLFENSGKFNVFRNHFSKFVQQTLNMANKELQKYDLSVQINTEYDIFDDDEWLACYDMASGYIEEGVIMIALNEKKIYDCMVDLGADEDLLEIELQAIITIMHEVGHGIIDWYRYQFEGEETAVGEYIDKLDVSSYKILDGDTDRGRPLNLLMILYIVTEMKKKIYAKNLAKVGHLLTQGFMTQP